MYFFSRLKILPVLGKEIAPVKKEGVADKHGQNSDYHTAQNDENCIWDFFACRMVLFWLVRIHESENRAFKHVSTRKRVKHKNQKEPPRAQWNNGPPKAFHLQLERNSFLKTTTTQVLFLVIEQVFLATDGLAAFTRVCGLHKALVTSLAIRHFFFFKTSVPDFKIFQEKKS